jgi:16S rRNA (guanine527-N7)-methyltransferase
VEHERKFLQALSVLNVADTQYTLEKFKCYADLIKEYNKKFNLISRNDEVRIFTRHFAESMGLALYEEFSKSLKVMDLGSGAGLPGIPLKLVRPNLHMVLLEPKRKRGLFLNRVLRELGLEGIEVWMARAEQLNEEMFFDRLICRAVSDLSTLVKWTHRLIKPGGKLLSLKGDSARDEVMLLQAKAEKWHISDLKIERYVPFENILVERECQLVIVEW